MIKLGFIGYGSMGSMLINGFITSGKIKPEEAIVSTRTRSRLEGVKEKWNEINIANDNVEVAKKAEIIFICVKPLEVKGVLAEIKDYLFTETHIILITGCVTIQNIEKLMPCKLTKVVPSLTSEVKEGISLVCHNKNVSVEEASYIESLLEGISKVKIIDESDFEAAADLTSCAPGLLSAIFRELVNSGIRHSSLKPIDAQEMVIRTLLGTAKLYNEMNMGFEETIARVATKGGITEEGVKILQAGLPQVFDELFEKTLGKYEKVKELINKQFEKKD